jgi:hypothetical protein
MTTAIRPDIERELAERQRAAWSRYTDSLRDLDGRAYEDAEAASWAELQRTLHQIDAERLAL